MTLRDTAPTLHTLPPGPDFLDRAAVFVLDAFAAAGSDPGQGWVIAPNLHLAGELRRAIARAAGRPILLPRCDTLMRLAAAQPLPPGCPDPLPDSARLLLLRQALAGRPWFHDRALWHVAAELLNLFDELTAHAVRLPGSAEDFVARLEAAYRLTASQPLAMEARLVHELWRVLSDDPRPDSAAAHALRLGALAESANRPLVVVCERPWEGAEAEFLAAYARHAPLTVIHPAERVAVAAPLPRVLAAAWPAARNGDAAGERSVPPLAERARAVAAELAAASGVVTAASQAESEVGTATTPSPAAASRPSGAPLSDRLALIPARGREAEARAATAQVLAWLGEGRTRLALIAQDRLTARRVRALLERYGVRVADETGWKLSTARAATLTDSLLEVALGQAGRHRSEAGAGQGGAYHRDVLDLAKSPFALADWPAGRREAAATALEKAVARANVRTGLDRFRRALAQEAERLDREGAAPAPSAEEQALAAAQDLLARIEEAINRLGRRAAPLPEWIGRLTWALEGLAALEPLSGDAAGEALLTLLATRAEELAGETLPFTLADFRQWLDRECEAETFRDRTIVSPVVMTHLAAALLRPFDGALILGGDAEQLAPPRPESAYFNQAVRRELGLPAPDGAARLEADLSLLIATVPRVTVTWQEERDGEARLLAPSLDRLSLLHRLAWGDDLKRSPLGLPEAPPPATLADLPLVPLPAPLAQAAPVLTPGDLPEALTVSALADLVACPYRFFARRVLRLGEADEVAEGLDKAGYGELIHGVLERFHGAHPVIAALAPEAALAELQAAVDEAFRPVVGDHYLSIAWRLRWEARLTAYLDWQRQREAAGWRWQAGEQAFARALPLADGGVVTLKGRIDRIDVHPDEGTALFDYKLKRIDALKKALPEDVQLPAYGWMAAEGLAAQGLAEVGQAAYVALDDASVGQVSVEGDPAAAGLAQAERLARAYADMRAGMPLPAHGSPNACAWCEAAGLCRTPHRE